jgi:hypothetical protein
MAHPTQDQDREAFFIDCPCYDWTTSKALPFKLKGWRYADGTVFLEVRRVLEAIFLGTATKWETARTLDKQFSKVHSAFENMGMTMGEELRPSRKAFETKYKAEGMTTEYIREDYSISCRGAVVWLLVWTAHRHTERDRKVCGAILHGIFSKCLPEHNVFSGQFLQLISGVLEECVMMESQTKPCGHIRYALQGLGDTAGNFCFADLIEALVNLLITTGCPATFKGFCLVVDTIGSNMDEFLLNRPEQNITTEDVRMKTRNGKMRRLDEDFKLAIAGVGHGEAGASSRLILRVTGVASPSSTNAWISLDLKSMMIAANRTMACNGVVCFSDDASRHGSPAEDTNVSLVNDCRADVALHGPPMVRASQTPKHNLWNSKMEQHNGFYFAKTTCV